MKKLFLLIGGTISLFLGVIGIFLPILPTTPLLLLAAFCYFRSSKRLYHKLLNNKILGPYIKNYYEKKAIPFKTKVWAIIFLWLSISLSIFIVEKNYLKLMLFIIATSVTVFICNQKTLYEH